MKNDEAIVFKTPLQLVPADLYQYFVSCPPDVVERVRDWENKRIVCTIDGKVSYHAALLHNGAGGFYITVNAERRKQLGLVAGQEVHISFVTDRSEYGMPLSDEFVEVVINDPAVSALFHALTPGKQRTLIYWCDQPKSSPIRIRRALVLAEHLIAAKGKPDFKEMNERLKAANARHQSGR